MKKLLLLFTCLYLLACSTKPVEPDIKTKLIGTWQVQDANGTPIVIDFANFYVFSITFAADGNFLTNKSSTNAGFKTGKWSLPDSNNVTFNTDYKIDAATNFSSTETDAISFDSKGRLLLTIAATPNFGGGTSYLARIGD